MAEIFAFPRGGYDVVVNRKEDILDYISDDIDKELLLTIVRQCEKDASNFLKEGRWTGIPFIGNIRIPKTVQLLNTEESKAILADAKDTLDKAKYELFKKSYTDDIGAQVKQNRYEDYIASKFATKNSKLFKHIVANKGIAYAKFFAVTLSNLTIVPTDEQV